jgi:hypothetical protein
MNPIDWIMFVIAAGVMLYGVWKFLPGGLYLFFPSGVRSHFDANNTYSQEFLQQGNVNFLVEQLKAMGFLPIGVKIEQRPLWGSISDLSLASNTAHTFASITVINSKTLYYFFTPFSGGQAVLTANDGFAAVHTEDFIQSTANTVTPSDLLAIHQRYVDEFRKKGFTPFSEFNQQSRLDATSLYYKINAVRGRMRKNGATYFILFLLFCFPFFYIIFNVLK